MIDASTMQQTARWLITVHGIVQGVGFRPFVYGLALRHGLNGWVRNDAAGVTIEAEGLPAALAAFAIALRADAPPLARVDAVEHVSISTTGADAFVIVESVGTMQRNTLIAPDSATCADCVRELFEPGDRRFRYPFINCTNCGPRFTIIADVPYDRPNTTMRPFAMCPHCQAEYDNPLDRRFHAQPNACPVCGPQLAFRSADGHRACDRTAALDAALAMVRDGRIVAIKGLGGYHLACDAANPDAVARLRARKHREAKPFALMVADLATARQLCHVSDDEAAFLTSQRRPILLLRRRGDAPIAPEIAPGRSELGLMLPYTPLHHLLMRDLMESGGSDALAALVLTSGNLSDEPIAFRDDDAFARLRTIADGFLYHNRAILTRCDDTVIRVEAGDKQVLRRSRGFAPEPLLLDQPVPVALLAVGAHLKNTFCLARERMAIVSHHIGDLENLETLGAFREGIAHLGRLFDIAPEAVAYDLHPEYLSTKEALAMPIARKIGVQHHHAHIASVLAEHGLRGRVIGVAADGTGYGDDGAIWGGEVLVADVANYRRVAHLAYVPLPGGDAAVREPWRIAASYLNATYGPGFLDLDLPFVQSLDLMRWRVLARMIGRGLNSPPTSSMGRLFDAVAALAGFSGEARYEGQAAIELEACSRPTEEAYSFAFVDKAPCQIDVRPAIRALVADLQRGESVATVGGRFHRTVAAFLAESCRRVRAATGLNNIALSGGVFQNLLLLGQLRDLLEADGFVVFANHSVPPNDGGISLGQLAVAAERMRTEEPRAKRLHRPPVLSA